MEGIIYDELYTKGFLLNVAMCAVQCVNFVCRFKLES